MSEENRSASFAVDRELARKEFMKKALWAGATLSAAGIGGFGIAVERVNAQVKEYTTYQGLGDAAILQFAYLLELLEGTFYAQGVNAGIFSGNSLAQIAAIRDHEMLHAQAISQTLTSLGAAVPATPNFTYPSGVFSDPVAFLKLAATFEPVGVGAYQGAAPALQSKAILAKAVTIHNIEGQHIVAINILQGVVPPANMAFGKALTLQAVKQAVAPFGITG